MTQVIDRPSTETRADLDLAVLATLQDSAEPITASKIKAALPSSFRSTTLEELQTVLARQTTANVVWQFPKYRGSQDRYWDKPMEFHVAALTRAALQGEPLAWSELRRRLPVYAQPMLEQVLQDLITRGQVHRVPSVGRGSERYWVWPPSPKDYLITEMNELFKKLETLGFTRDQIQESAREILHEEEWASRNETATP